VTQFSENGIFCCKLPFFEKKSPNMQHKTIFRRRVSPHLCLLAIFLWIPWNNVTD
jgi:hypothetical protein